MGIWDGKAPERIAAFVTKHGHDTLWSYLQANPNVPLVALADQIGDVAAVQIQSIAVDQCFRIKQLGALIRDLLARGIHESLPDGWGSKSAFAQAQAVSIDGFPAPFDELATLTGRRLNIVIAPHHGWLPKSGEDPLIIKAFENAFDALPADTQRIITGEQRALRPGEAAWERLGPHWDAVSIYDGSEVFLDQLNKLPAGIGHLLVTHWFQSEARNGGLHQFFGNSTGVLAPEAVAGLRALQLNQTAELLSEAMRFFGPQYPRDRSVRMAALHKHAGRLREEWDPFFKLDDRLFELLDEEAGGYTTAADRFAATLDS